MEKIDHNSLFVIIGDVKDQASIKIVIPSCDDDPFLESSKEKIIGAKQNTIFTRLIWSLERVSPHRKKINMAEKLLNFDFLTENDASSYFRY